MKMKKCKPDENEEMFVYPIYAAPTEHECPV